MLACVNVVYCQPSNYTSPVNFELEVKCNKSEAWQVWWNQTWILMTTGPLQWLANHPKASRSDYFWFGGVVDRPSCWWTSSVSLWLKKVTEVWGVWWPWMGFWSLQSWPVLPPDQKSTAERHWSGGKTGHVYELAQPHVDNQVLGWAEVDHFNYFKLMLSWITKRQFTTLDDNSVPPGSYHDLNDLVPLEMTHRAKGVGYL